MHIVQLLLVDGAGGAHHQVLGVLVHGEGDDLPDALLAGEHHDQPVHAGGCTGMGGCAVGEGIVHGGELGLDVVLAQAHHLEGLDHDLGVVVPDGAGSTLVAVAHQVVLVGIDGQQLFGIALGLFQGLQAALGHGEGVVAEFQLAGFLADLVHGEVHDPAQSVLLLVEVAGHPLAKQGTDDACGLLGGGLLAGGHADEGAGLQGQLFLQSLAAVAQELGDAAGESAILVHLDPAGLVAGLDLYIGQQLIDPLSGLGEVVHSYGFDGGALEGAEAAALNDGRNVLDLQVDPQVGLVGAVALHGLVVGDVPPGSLGHPLKLAELLVNRLQNRFQSFQHVLLRGEGHLHIQLVEFAGGAVCPGVLIPEAGGDLEILVEAGGHQQLLELLRGLGQGIELAGVVPGGDQIVSRALGTGGGQNGGGDLQEAQVRHPLAQLGHHLAAEHDVGLDGGVPQVQEAVFQPGILIGIPALVDLKGQLVVEALAQHLDFLGHDFNVAGGQLGIFALPLPDGAGDGDGGFLIDGLDQLHHVLGLHHHLSGAVVVPQHQEGKVGAHFPDVFQPADDGHFLACVPEPQLAAGIRSGLLHKKASLVSKFNAAIFSQIPEKVNRRYCFLRATLRKTDGFAFADNIAFMGAIVRCRR